MKIKLLFLFVMLISSCSSEFDGDKKTQFSYLDPFFLKIDDVLIDCKSNKQTPLKEWQENFQNLLDDYRLDNLKINFKELLLKKDDEKLCGLISNFQEEPKSYSSFKKDKKVALLMNTYHLMALTIIAKNYSEVLEVGKPDLAENRSLLNIKNKGLKVFSEIKLHVLSGFHSLDDIEKKIEDLTGRDEKISLFRGMKGFGPLPEKVLSASNINTHIDQYIDDIVNNSTFFDELSDPPTAFIPGNLGVFIDEFPNKEDDLRGFIEEKIDLDIWPLVKIKEKTNNQFVWKIELDGVINWQLAE